MTVFQELIEPPTILPLTKFQLPLSSPDFSHYPESVFSAKHSWTPPRTVQLTKNDKDGYGLRLQGNGPVVVLGVEQHGLAEVGGVLS